MNISSFQVLTVHSTGPVVARLDMVKIVSPIMVKFLNLSLEFVLMHPIILKQTTYFSFMLMFWTDNAILTAVAQKEIIQNMIVWFLNVFPTVHSQICLRLVLVIHYI